MINKLKWASGTGLAAISVAATLPGLAAAQDISALEARIAALEAEKAASPVSVAAPGVKLDFYGFTKLDMVTDNHYDLGNTTGGMAGVTESSIRDGGSGAHAYESRLGVKASVDTDLGQMKVVLEGDFYGNGGGGFRLRHAYGELGPLLAGQTWTNWIPVEGGLSAVQDFNAPAGATLYRTAQIRYTYRPSEQLRFAAAIEEDYAPGNSSKLALTASAGYTGAKFKLGGGLISRNLETATNRTVHGFGYSIGADVDAWQGGKVQLQYVGGKGIATSMNNTAFAGIEIGALGKYAFDIDANGDAIKVKGIKAGITQKIGEKSDLSISYGVQRFDDYAGALGSYTKELNSTYLTYRYNATKSVMLAAEVGKVERKQFDGASFDNTRVQGVVKFSF